MCCIKQETVSAADAPALSDDQLMTLGRLYAEKIGQRAKETDLLLSGRAGALKLAEMRASAQILDGEPLLMQGMAGPSSLALEGIVTAERRDDRLMFSLAEFCAAVEFPITVSEGGTAAGWFFRESRAFFLDTKKLEAVVEGVTLPVDPADVAVGADGGILVSTTQLEKWFGVEISLDFTSLSFNVRAPVPLPVEERRARSAREKYAPSSSQVAKLPLKDMPYGFFTPPYFDVALGASTLRAGSNAKRKDSMQWSVIGSGDLAGFSSKTFVIGNEEDTPSAIRQTFSRESPSGWGAGPLKARAFSFGDIYTPSLPILGGGLQEQGVTVSSRREGEATTLDRIDVRGDVQPGWDVELYNNGALVGFQQAGDDGLYNFQSVFLTAGENALRIVFYGPQGEIREETRTVIAGGLENGGGAWDLSVSRANVTTYDAKRSRLPSDGEPQVTARFEKSLGMGRQASAGYLRRSLTDGIVAKRKDYLQAGLADAIGGVLLTANAAYDMDGALSSELLARRNFGAHQTGLSLRQSFGDFEQDTVNNFTPVFDAGLFVRGPLPAGFLGLTSPLYTVDTSYVVPSDASGALGVFTGNTVRAAGTIGGRLGNVALNSGLNWQRTPGGTGADMSGYTTANGFFGKGRWRLTSNYDVVPAEMTSYVGSYTYPFRDGFSGTADLSYNALSSTTAGRVSADWRTDKYALSPYVGAGSGGNFSAGLNMRFGLVQDPYSGSYGMSSRLLSNSGGAGARVFLDKNGDGIYNDGEEFLEEVQLQSRQSSRTAYTDKKGVAFIPDLPTGARTDIVIEQTTLPDPYYMSMEEGSSIYPRPGVTARFDFPVVVSGEMDGRAELKTADGAASALQGARVQLVAPDGRIEKSAVSAHDGYWSMSGIRPGVYYLTAAPSNRKKPGFLPPRLVTFAATGTNAFGQAVSLLDAPQMRFSFLAANRPPGGSARVQLPEDIADSGHALEIGAFRSRMSLVIAWFKLMLDSDHGMDHYKLAVPLQDIAPDASGAMHLTLLPKTPLTLDEAVTECRGFQERGVSCGVGIVTRWKEEAPPPEKAAQGDVKSMKIKT